MSRIKSAWSWLRGKRTYLISFAGVVLGIAQVLGGDVDGGVAVILGSLGFGTVRAGVANDSRKKQDAVADYIFRKLEQKAAEIEGEVRG